MSISIYPIIDMTLRQAPCIMQVAKVMIESSSINYNHS